MGARIDGRDDATHAPLVVRGGALHGHALRAAGRERAGEDGGVARGPAGRRARPRSSRPRRAAITPSACSSRSACADHRRRSRGPRRAGRAAAVRDRRSRRSVVGRVLRGRGRDHARLRHRHRIGVVQPDASGFRHSDETHGRRHRAHADRRGVRRTGRRAAGAVVGSCTARRSRATRSPT